jgi:hypothetical protein
MASSPYEFGAGLELEYLSIFSQLASKTVNLLLQSCLIACQITRWKSKEVRRRDIRPYDQWLEIRARSVPTCRLSSPFCSVEEPLNRDASCAGDLIEHIRSRHLPLFVITGCCFSYADNLCELVSLESELLADPRDSSSDLVVNKLASHKPGLTNFNFGLTSLTSWTTYNIVIPTGRKL